MGKSEKSFELQVSLYGLEAVYLACYALLDRAYIRLEGDPKATIRIRVKAKEDSGGASVDALTGELENELLHQALRTRVSAANQKIREHIVTRALAAAQGVAPEPASEPCGCGAPHEGEESLLDEELEKEVDKLLAEVEKEGGEDPLNIAAPWEQSQGSGEKAAKAKAGKKKRAKKTAAKVAGKR
ncbi:His-Xaa-Ser system protein HxsD [Elusimicrobiota bacterium]